MISRVQCSLLLSIFSVVSIMQAENWFGKHLDTYVIAQQKKWECFSKDADIFSLAIMSEVNRAIENHDDVVCSKLFKAIALENETIWAIIKTNAIQTQYIPLIRALQATENIFALGNFGLSRTELLQLAFFIETSLLENIKKRQYYIRKETTGLSRTIEYDPKTKKVFIHLKTHSIEAIGRGSSKLITKSIEYHFIHPCVVANCIGLASDKAINREIMHLSALGSAPGIIEMRAITQHINKRGQKVTSIFFKLYDCTVRDLINNHVSLTLKQKMTIAYDLLQGLVKIHEKSIIHRDLHPANYLVWSENHGQDLHAVISDFGLSRSEIDTKKNLFAQAIQHLNAPEVITKNRRRVDYKSCDVYALGYGLYRLLYNQEPQYKNGTNIENLLKLNSKELDYLRKALIRNMETEISPRRNELIARGRHGVYTVEEEFELLILQMIHHDPKMRGSAKLLCKQLMKLMKRL